MRINLFLNEKYFKDLNIKEAVDDYKIRCRRFVDIKLFYKYNLKIFDSTSYNINVTKSGKFLDSYSFSTIINNCVMDRFKNLNILFEYKELGNLQNICFSNIDILSTGFLYVMTIEQIYRAYKIINNEPYHK